MALAESFLRTIHKLGLLPKIIRALPILSFFLAIASFGWLLVLPMDGQYRNTYISENALMPGQVISYFRESEWNIVRGYRMEVTKWNFHQASEANPLLESWLEDSGLKIYHHQDPKTESDTMYAVMHAARGDNTESLALVVPYFTSDGQANIGAMSIAAALARYFTRMSIWQKNIIFVFPHDGHAVLRSWVEAYHSSLDDTPGSIEAAIVMEYASALDNFSHMELFYEGLNGQLPNLDLINTVTTIARNEQIKVSIQGAAGDDLDRNTYFTRLRTLLTGILNLAISGLSETGPGCESFSGWQIQAITIRAVGEGGPDITQFGRIVDSTFRAVNNLLEKFHQSFFFYLMLTPLNFVSIGTYLPSAALLAASFAISSIYCLATGVSTKDYISEIGHVLTTFTGIEFACLVASIALTKFVVVLPDFLSPLLVFLFAGSIVLSLCPSISILPHRKLSKPMSYLLLAFSLYFIAMLIVSLLIVHFALALCLGACAFPLSLIPALIKQSVDKKSSASKINTKISLCLLASSPVTAIVALGYTLLNGKYEGALFLIKGLLSAWREMQCWTWFVLSLGWFPAWIAIVVACSLGQFSDAEKTKKE